MRLLRVDPLPISPSSHRLRLGQAASPHPIQRRGLLSLNFFLDAVESLTILEFSTQTSAGTRPIQLYPSVLDQIIPALVCLIPGRAQRVPRDHIGPLRSQTVNGQWRRIEVTSCRAIRRAICLAHISNSLIVSIYPSQSQSIPRNDSLVFLGYSAMIHATPACCSNPIRGPYLKNSWRQRSNQFTQD